jgi:hypothetical protein
MRAATAVPPLLAGNGGTGHVQPGQQGAHVPRAADALDVSTMLLHPVIPSQRIQRCVRGRDPLCRPSEGIPATTAPRYRARSARECGHAHPCRDGRVRTSMQWQRSVWPQLWQWLTHFRHRVAPRLAGFTTHRAHSHMRKPVGDAEPSRAASQRSREAGASGTPFATPIPTNSRATSPVHTATFPLVLRRARTCSASSLGPASSSVNHTAVAMAATNPNTSPVTRMPVASRLCPGFAGATTPSTWPTPGDGVGVDDTLVTAAASFGCWAKTFWANCGFWAKRFRAPARILPTGNGIVLALLCQTTKSPRTL